MGLRVPDQIKKVGVRDQKHGRCNSKQAVGRSICSGLTTSPSRPITKLRSNFAVHVHRTKLVHLEHLFQCSMGPSSIIYASKCIKFNLYYEGNVKASLALEDEGDYCFETSGAMSPRHILEVVKLHISHCLTKLPS